MKQQFTENQKDIYIRMSGNGGPVFTLTYQGGGSPPFPRQLGHCRLEQFFKVF